MNAREKRQRARFYSEIADLLSMQPWDSYGVELSEAIDTTRTRVNATLTYADLHRPDHGVILARSLNVDAAFAVWAGATQEDEGSLEAEERFYLRVVLAALKPGLVLT